MNKGPASLAAPAAVVAIAALAAAGCGAGSAQSPADPRSMAFVVTSWYTALHETKYMEECPEGLAIGSDEIWFEGLSPADKQAKTRGGTLQPTDPARKAVSYLRGPDGEDVCWNPTAVRAAPMRTVEGRFSYGRNLDGNASGAATPKSCPHRNFTGLDGTAGVDNQLYRLVGCIYGFRSSGYLEDHANRERRDEGQGNILVEVTDVDDRRDDDHVTVRFFLADTPLPHDAAGHIMPWSSYRIRGDLYGDTVRGRIVAGRLVTEPATVRLPYYGNDGATDMVFRDFRLEAEIAPDGGSARGLWTGYYDLESWWDSIQKLQHNAHVGQYDCPALYQAAHELADGYPDPKTGDCTALSSAFRFEAVAAFVARR